MRIYIAAPYTIGDVGVNVRNAIYAADALANAGHHPFCPLLTHLWHIVHPRTWEDWIRIDLAWLDVAEAVVRLPGASKGADLEVMRASELGLPVHHGVAAFLKEIA